MNEGVSVMYKFRAALSETPSAKENGAAVAQHRHKIEVYPTNMGITCREIGGGEMAKTKKQQNSP